MVHIIRQCSVATAVELAAFERDMHDLTLGYSLARSMSYNTFRRMVLQYHLTGKPTAFKCFLEHNHFLYMEDGIATLYRIVDEKGEKDEGEKHRQDDSDSDEVKPRPRKKPKVGTV